MILTTIPWDEVITEHAFACSVDGCDQAAVTRGHCGSHAQQFRRTGRTWPLREFHHRITPEEAMADLEDAAICYSHARDDAYESARTRLRSVALRFARVKHAARMRRSRQKRRQ